MPYTARSKKCVRCGGSLSLERDAYGTYMECIQCGAIPSETDVFYPGTCAGSGDQTSVILGTDVPAHNNKQNLPKKHRAGIVNII